MRRVTFLLALLLGASTAQASGLFGPFVPPLTTGSIAFKCTTGPLCEDNANLFWDDSNDILKVRKNLYLQSAASSSFQAGYSQDFITEGVNYFASLNQLSGGSTVVAPNTGFQFITEDNHSSQIKFGLFSYIVDKSTGASGYAIGGGSEGYITGGATVTEFDGHIGYLEVVNGSATRAWVMKSEGAQADGTNTIGDAVGFYSAAHTKDAGATITNAYGFLAVDQTVGTNNFGYVSQVTAGANKYAFRDTGGAKSVLAGPLTAASLAVTSSTLPTVQGMYSRVSGELNLTLDGAQPAVSIINDGLTDGFIGMEVGGSGVGLYADGSGNKDFFLSSLGTGTIQFFLSTGTKLAAEIISNGLNLYGATSGAVSVKTQAAAGTYNFNLPIAAGTSGDWLTSGGGASTAMTWTTPASGVATFVTTPSSANLKSALTNELDPSGSGLAIFSPGGLNVTTGKTLTATQSITLTGTDSTVMTLPTTTATIARTDAAQSFTGAQTFNTPVAPASGGTGQSSYAIGDIPYASASTTISKLADVAAGSYLRSGGVTTAPVWSTTTLPNSATTGDVLYASASNVYSNLADVAAGSFLRSGGTSTAPAWSTLVMPNAITSGGIFYGSAANTAASSGALTSNAMVKGGGAGGAPTSGQITDDGTTITLPGTTVNISATTLQRSGNTVLLPRRFTTTYDPASLTAATAREDTVTVTGITTAGGAVAMNLPTAMPAGCVVANIYASAADTVKVDWQNSNTVAACDVASSTAVFTQAQ